MRQTNYQLLIFDFSPLLDEGDRLCVHLHGL